jgi:FeS assembly SUF system protein
MTEATDHSTERADGMAASASETVEAATAVDQGSSGAAAAASAISPDEIARLTDDIVAALKTVYDPEIPADIYELGLIYRIDIEDDRSVKIDMTLTAPGCPVAGEMPGWVENAVGAVEGVSGVDVSMVFDPPWTPDRMSEEAQVAVGWY